MNIRSVLDNLITLEAGLSITSPETLSIARAYKLTPSRNKKLPDFPCFMNVPILPELEFRFPTMLRRNYDIQIQLFVKNSDFDRAVDIAASFEEELIRALADDLTLGGTVHNIVSISGEMALLEWAGDSYPGLDYTLQVNLTDAEDYGTT